MAVIQSAYLAHLRQKALDFIQQARIYFQDNSRLTYTRYLDITSKEIQEDGYIVAKVMIPPGMIPDRQTSIIRADILNGNSFCAAIGIPSSKGTPMSDQDNMLFVFKFKIIADE